MSRLLTECTISASLVISGGPKASMASKRLALYACVLVFPMSALSVLLLKEKKVCFSLSCKIALLFFPFSKRLQVRLCCLVSKSKFYCSKFLKNLIFCKKIEMTLILTRFKNFCRAFSSTFFIDKQNYMLWKISEEKIRPIKSLVSSVALVLLQMQRQEGTKS